MFVDKDILYIQDPIGISSNMMPLFHRLSQDRAVPVSLYRLMSKNTLLRVLKNRKAPAFSNNAVTQTKIKQQLDEWLAYYQPRVIVTSDPATLFLCDPTPELNYMWMTIDNMRGGVYTYRGIPLIITYPPTAWYREIRERDIAKVNDGFSDKDSFESAMTVDNDTGEKVETPDDDDDDDKVFYAPVLTKVQVGKFTLTHDWAKVHRIAAQHERYQPPDGVLQAKGFKKRASQSESAASLAAKLKALKA